MTKLATIETIQEISPHPNADRLVLAKVAGYTVIVPKDVYLVGQKVVFISPDSVLPDVDWAEPFKKYAPKRIRAIKIRNVFSFGIVVDLNTCGLADVEIGQDVSELLGVEKYEAPAPQDLSAKGGLPFGLFKTDEDRYQSLDYVPYGEVVNVTLKTDGQSSTFYCKNVDGQWVTGICSRSLEIKEDADNNFTRVNKKYNILDKLEEFCKENNRSIALRGEVFGTGIQNFSVNPHCKKNLGWACFSALDMDTLRYFRRDDELYFTRLCEKLSLPCVPVLEEGVVLSKDLIKKYSEELTHIDGEMFEGVVVNTDKTSFKIINLAYDAKK